VVGFIRQSHPRIRGKKKPLLLAAIYSPAAVRLIRACLRFTLPAKMLTLVIFILHFSK